MDWSVWVMGGSEGWKGLSDGWEGGLISFDERQLVVASPISLTSCR